MKSRLALLCKTAIVLQVSFTRDDLLLLFCFCFCFFIDFLFIFGPIKSYLIKYLKLLTIGNTILIFHFYKQIIVFLKSIE